MNSSVKIKIKLIIIDNCNVLFIVIIIYDNWNLGKIGQVAYPWGTTWA